MNLKNWVLFIIVTTALMGNLAHSACSFSGKVERIYQITDTSFIYMLPQNSVTQTYYRYFSTNDAGLLKAANTAYLENKHVKIKGNASACPSAIMARYGSYGGVVTNIINN